MVKDTQGRRVNPKLEFGDFCTLYVFLQEKRKEKEGSLSKKRGKGKL